MWALLLVLAGMPLKVEQRPAPVPKDELAQVLMGEGDVMISAGSGAPFAARVGYVLGTGDLIKVPANAWVTLSLTNGHVVRLDDDVEVKVESLAMLRAAAQTRSYKEQLDALVTRKEQDNAQRIAGWHVSTMAANVIGSTESPQGGGEEGKDPTKTKRADVREEDQLLPGGPARRRQSTEVPRSPPSPPPPAIQPAAVAPVSPADPALTRCVETAINALETRVKLAAGKTIRVKVRVRDGQLQVAFGEGLTAPACIATWAQQQTLTDTWRRFDVKLK